MIINAYICTDDENVISKTLTLQATFDGTLREPSSILKPSITFEYSGNPSTWTHFGIADFARIYFITDIISVGKNLWQISGRVDVLYTYRGNRVDRDGLYGLTGIVVRNADDTDGTLTDGAIPIQNNTDLTVIDGVITDISNIWASSENVMKSTYQGDDGAKRYVQIAALAPYSPASTLILSGMPQAFYCMNQSAYFDILQAQLQVATLFNQKTFTDYILANYWLPFQPALTGDVLAKLERPSLSGDFTFPNNSAYIIARGYYTASWTVTIPCDAVYKYKNFAPYKDVYLQFFPFGRLRLDNSVLFSGVTGSSVTIFIKVVCDPKTGDALLYYGRTSDANIFLAQSNVKIDLPVSAQLTNFGGIASGVLATVVAAATAIETGGASAYLGAAGTVIGSMSNAVNASRGSSAGGLSGKFIDGKPKVLVYENTTNAAARNNAILGQPLYESRALHTIYGYAEITHVHFDGINATAAEKEELKALLAAGVIFDNETP